MAVVKLELDFAVASSAASVAMLALALLSRICRCYCGVTQQAPTSGTRHLQEQLLVHATHDLPATSVQVVLLPPTKLLSTGLAALAYALALFEVLQLWLNAVAWPTALRALAFLVLAVATEVEVGGTPPLGSRLPSIGLWRCRAALRSACAASLALVRMEPFMKLFGLATPADEPAWQGVSLAVATAALAAGLLASACVGPTRLVPMVSPAPPMRSAWLVPKLLYLFWLPEVLRLRRLANDATQSLGVGDLPTLPSSIASATAWATGAAPRERFARRCMRRDVHFDRGVLPDCAGPSDGAADAAARRRVHAESRRSALIGEMMHVARLDAALQFCWCLGVLVFEYAAPFGMMGLIDYVGSGAVGPIPPRAIGFGAMVALGPLAVQTCHGQANASGWTFGTTLRAYITRAVTEKALRFDMAATEQSTGQLTNLLAVDAYNVVTFAGMSAWLWLEGLQLVTTLAALYYLLGIAALGGLAVCLLAFPLNTIVMRRVKRLQERLMKQKDRCGIASRSLARSHAQMSARTHARRALSLPHAPRRADRPAPCRA